MSKLDKDQVIEQFKEAYVAANGKEPVIEAKSGWYSVDGGKNIRLAQLQEMIAELGSSDAPQASEEAAEAPAKEPETVEAKPAATERKPKASKPKASKKGDFSVKAYWIEKLDQEHPGSTAPR